MDQERFCCFAQRLIQCAGEENPQAKVLAESILLRLVDLGICSPEITPEEREQLNRIRRYINGCVAGGDDMKKVLGPNG